MRNPVVPTHWVSVGRKGWWLTAALLLAAGAGPAGRAQTAPTLAEIRARAENADLDALNTLGNASTNALLGLKQDYGEALKWYRVAADKNFAPAQFNLGLAYELGRGVPVDVREAFRYYMLAAQQGFVPALFNVGNMYATGRGVGQDLFEANIWYRQAADKGLPEAQFNLGLAYETGRGVKQDETQAARWYQLAAEKGYALALYNLGLLFEDGRGVAKDEAAAAGMYRAAANRGVGAAQNNYGLMLLEGRGGLPKDPAEAYVWLSLAVDHGVDPAARDTTAKSLEAGPLAAANRRLAELRAGKAPADAAPNRPADPLPLPPDRTGVVASSAVERPADPAVAGPGATPAEVARYQAEITALTARLKQTTGALDRLQQASQRSRPEIPPAPANRNDEPTTFKSKYPVQESDTDVIISGLRRDNTILNEELKRATRELLWLKQQKQDSENAVANGAGKAAGELRAAQDEVTRLTAELNRVREARPPAEAANAQVAELNSRVRELTAQLHLAQSRPPAPVKEEGSPALAQLQQQVQLLQGEKADLEKWTQVLESTLREKSAQSAPDSPGATGSNPVLDQVQQQLASSNAALESELVRSRKLAEDNRALADRVQHTEELLSVQTKGDPSDINRLQRQIVELQQKVVKQGLEKEALANVLAGEQAGAKRVQSEISALERELRDAKAAATRDSHRPPAPSAELAEAGQTIAKLNATVAELTGANGRLEQELAKAGPAAAPPGFNRTESSGPLPPRVKELEAQLEDERGKAAREVAALAAQLQRARETNRTLTAASREGTAAGDELRRQNQRLSEEVQAAGAERDALKARLAEARPPVVRSAENTGLQEQLAAAQRELATRQKRMDELAVELAASRQALAQAAAVRPAAGADTAQVNLRLEQEREDMRRLVESYRADIARLTQNVRTAEQQRTLAEQQRTQAERNGQQNFDATTSQLRRELDAARAGQSRQAEALAAQERERTAIITQLRTENSALAARLNQTQGTLDQIAGSLRLTTPAANIVSSGAVPVVRTLPPPAVEPRYHTVVDGDSLSRISLRYYGTASRWEEIYRANSDVLQGSSTLRVGQQLRIP